MRGAVAGMHVGVDEARCHELAARVDLLVDRTVEALADEQNRIAFVTQLGVAPEGVVAVGMTNEPAAFDPGAHQSFTPACARSFRACARCTSEITSRSAK